ncbi:hypothetical protein J2W97_002246 [Paenibacillus jamilae]|nr:hypothetical protein [Paenibacillus jamilae]
MSDAIRPSHYDVGVEGEVEPCRYKDRYKGTEWLRSLYHRCMYKILVAMEAKEWNRGPAKDG